jgi:hypothetical protein
VKTIALKTLFVIFAVLFATSCASVKFYTDESLKKETGLCVYPPKPYLLVEHGTSKTVNLKATIVYLPDLTEPRFLRFRPGIGSSSVKVELEDGMLKSYGLTTDTKVPETIDKLSSLFSRSASAIGDLTNNKTAEASESSDFELYEIVMEGGKTRLVPVK